MTGVKICGIRDLETLQMVADTSAEFVGLVFYPPSPRYIELDVAQTLTQAMPKTLRSVGLFVEPTDQEVLRIISSAALDMIQLHGDETPQRVEQIAALTNLPVIKAIRVSGAEDIDRAHDYEECADWLLFDTKCPPTPPSPHKGEDKGGGVIYGGTGERFDWEILKGRTFKKPWMLSGGLTPENVAEAITTLKPNTVDVSSGVEAQRGIKDPERIKAFVNSIKFA